MLELNEALSDKYGSDLTEITESEVQIQNQILKS